MDEIRPWFLIPVFLYRLAQELLDFFRGALRKFRSEFFCLKLVQPLAVVFWHR
jgi:hypothetical protein